MFSELSTKVEQLNIEVLTNIILKHSLIIIKIRFSINRIFN